MAKNPFRRSEAEVKRNKADIEAALAPKAEGMGDGSNVAPPAEPTATEPDASLDARAKLGPLSSIGPSELLDRLEASKTGKAKIEAGRDYAKAVPEATSEDLVVVMGNRGLWPSGTVRKATAILQASPAQ